MAGIEITTLAYVAAAIDTQGIIRTRIASGTELPLVAVHGSNTGLLQYLAHLTGTRAVVTRRSYSKAGCAEHCAEKHQHIVSKSGRWSITGAKATVLLYNIRPFVMFQVDEIRSALDLGLNTGFKPATVRRMEELGWEVPTFDQTRLIRQPQGTDGRFLAR